MIYSGSGFYSKNRGKKLKIISGPVQNKAAAKPFKAFTENNEINERFDNFL
jgi:hypothetical protein